MLNKFTISGYLLFLAWLTSLQRDSVRGCLLCLFVLKLSSFSLNMCWEHFVTPTSKHDFSSFKFSKRFALYLGENILVWCRVGQDVCRRGEDRRTEWRRMWEEVCMCITTQLHLHHPSAPTWPHLTHVYTHTYMTTCKWHEDKKT